jgi:regulator of sigma E protease
MFVSIFYLVLAILGLGFLIFIHELGHYLVARRVGMTVEVFSIGIGTPIREWTIQGVKWKLCMLPFGGYVRIAGMDKKGNLEPHQIPDGFYGKKPLDRIKVALAGPLVNIVFAFIAFCGIWVSGGQEKPFQEYTNVIGYVDPQSKLYTNGVRPGDEFTTLDGKSVGGYKDLLISLILEEKAATLKGNEINYFSGQKQPFSIVLPVPTHGATKPSIPELGIIPAQYLIFNDFSSPASPLQGTGIQKGDRIVWVDGDLIFSAPQLSAVLNDSKSVLTFERNGQILHSKVPRLKISDLCLNAEQKSELDDWQHEAGYKSKVSQLYFIPYLLNHDGVVEKIISFMNCNADKVQPITEARHPLALLLQPGDRIIAVDGAQVSNSIELLKSLQNRNASVIVQRAPESSIPSWKTADSIFESSIKPAALQQIIANMGSAHPVTKSDSFILLPPISLKPLSELALDSTLKAQFDADIIARKKQIDKIENADQREHQLTLLEESQKKLMLGAHLRDRTVAYNPSPVTLFADVFEQTWKTLSSLLTGYLSPKALAGPVGIVQALQNSWANGVKDALFWLGFVSLNLAFLNLLPIPVLDGGHILFASIEGITKKRVKSKTMEKLILPFVILLVILFVYLTYQDIVKLLQRLF